MAHDQHLFALLHDGSDRLCDQASLGFVFAFIAGRHAAVKTVLRFVAQRHLVAAAALRHVERLACGVVGVVEAVFAAHTDRQRQVGLLAVIGEIAHLVENLELVVDHPLQRFFLHNDQHPVGRDLAAQRAVARCPVVDHLFDHGIDGGAFALFKRLQQLVGVVEHREHHARARIVIGALRLPQSSLVEEIQQIQRLFVHRHFAGIHSEKLFAAFDLEPAADKKLVEAVAPQKLLELARDGLFVDMERRFKRAVEPKDRAGAVGHTTGHTQCGKGLALFIVQLVRHGVDLIQQLLLHHAPVYHLQQEKHNEYARLHQRQHTVIAEHQCSQDQPCR